MEQYGTGGYSMADFGNLKIFGFKSHQGLWNPRESTLQILLSKSPLPGRAKHVSFQIGQNFFEKRIKKIVFKHKMKIGTMGELL